MDYLSPDHFLSLPRPDILIGPPTGVPDTTTLAAHDFDVDTRTGFMPPEAPVYRLTADWAPWEIALDDAISLPLKLGDSPHIAEVDKQNSERWRERIRNVRDLLYLLLTTPIEHTISSYLFFLPAT